MRPQLAKARCVAAAILVIVALVKGQESRNRSTPSSTKPVSAANRPSGKPFEEEARELAQVLETNPMLEIKSKRMSPFSEVVLLRYVALNQKKMPMLVAARQGRSSQVEMLLKSVGAKIYFAAPEIDYFRCIVDTDKVIQVFDAEDVLDVHLGIMPNIGNEFDADGFPPPRRSEPSGKSRATPLPLATTTLSPMSKGDFAAHLSSSRVGLEGFWKDHPTYDGRGVTIAQMDSGTIWDTELLTTAKDLQGNRIPKLATIYNPYDYDYETGWESVRTTAIRTVRVVLSEPKAINGSTLLAGGKRFETSGSGTYSVGVLRTPFGRREFPLLFNDDTGEIRLDVDNDGSFANDQAYGDFEKTHIAFQYSANNRPVVEGAFTVRPDHTIAVVFPSGHATMSGVAAAGNDAGSYGPLGAAPGARLSFANLDGGVYAFVEAALHMAQDPTVDIINYSATPSVYRERQPFVAKILNRIVSRYRKPVFASAGNTGDMLGSVSEIAAADSTIAVGGWASHHQDASSILAVTSTVDTITAHGPSPLGRPKPEILIPSPMITGTSSSSKCSDLQSHGLLVGAPACIGAYSFTSFYAPYAAGIGAVLLSAAKQEQLQVDGPRLRYSLEASARFLGSSPAHAQGYGALDVNKAWAILKSTVKTFHEYYTAAYVLDPDAKDAVVGRGVLDFVGPSPGDIQRRTICFRSGDLSASITSTAVVNLIGNDGTFSVAHSLIPITPHTACLDLTIAPLSEGLHSILIRLDRGEQMLAGTQATVLTPSRPTANSHFNLTHNGTAGSERSDSWWFELSNPSTVPIVKFDVLSGSGQLNCLPRGMAHPVFSNYYTPRLIPATYPPTAHGPGTYWAILDIPHATVWSCSVTAGNSSQPVTFRLTVLPVTQTHETVAHDWPSLRKYVPSALTENPSVAVEPITLLIPPTEAGRGDVISRDFVVPESAASLRIDAGAGRAHAGSWTLFRCTEGQCRAWYSSAIDRASNGSFVVHRPEPGRWKLVVLQCERPLPISVAITTSTGATQMRDFLAKNAVEPSICRSSGCLVRIYNPILTDAEQKAPWADFLLPIDRRHRRPLDVATILVLPDAPHASGTNR